MKDVSMAWVTYAENAEEVPSARLFLRSLKSTFSSKKTVLLVPVKNNIPKNLQATLAAEFDRVYLVPKSNLGFATDCKIHCLSLLEFGRLGVLPPTALMLENCDKILENVDDGNTGALGFSVLKPDFGKYQEYLEEDIEINGLNLSNEKSRQTPFIRLDDEKMSWSLEKWLVESPKIVDFGSFSFPKTPGSIFVKDLFNYREKQLHSIDYSVLESYAKEPIAIVGYSCRLPDSLNAEDYWKLLIEEKCAVRSLPENRWTPSQVGITLSPEQRQTQAGFLPSSIKVEEFDAKFFGINGPDAEYLDPQIRMMLEASWEALEDAGINPHSLHGSKRAGVYASGWATDYNELLKRKGKLENGSKFKTYFGNSFGVACSRLAFCYGVSGPTHGPETACSTSSVAICMSVNDLRSKKTDLALVGGVNLLLGPYINQDIMHLLSPEYRCKVFDSEANGFVRSEGCGILVLKRLSTAIQDGDRIHGLIRGVGLGQEGNSSSMGTPTVETEAHTMQLALQDGAVAAEDVDVVEAHGTGTAVGDPMEMAAIGKVYARTNSDIKPLIVCGGKGNIGHTEAASGVAGIVKSLLQFKYNVIPPQFGLKSLNPRIDLNAIPANIPLKATEFVRNSKGKQRMIGVSSFGITGADTHIILEEAPNYIPNKWNIYKTYPRNVVVISAKSKEGLEAMLAKYENFLAEGNINEDEINLENIAFTANTGKAQFKHRAAITASSLKELRLKLLNRKEIVVGQEANEAQKVTLLFPGQGSQYAGMGKQLYESCPLFKVKLDECDTILKKLFNIYIKEALWGDSTHLLSTSLYSQSTIFVIEYCLQALLASWGIVPDAVIGHSLGEFAAATTAGILNLEDALTLLGARCILINELPLGKMIAVSKDDKSAEILVEQFLKHGEKEKSLWLDIAARNGPNQTTLVGPPKAVETFHKFCQENGIKATILDASHAYHSRDMEFMLHKYRKVAESIKYNKVNEGLTFISGVDGKEVKNVDAEYWIRHTREAVKFQEAVKLLDLSSIFLEVGPHPVLSALLIQNMNTSPLCFPTLRKPGKLGGGDFSNVLDTLGKLWIRGIAINWREFHRFQNQRKISLPFYPFQRKRYWFPLRTGGQSAASLLNPILGSRLDIPGQKEDEDLHFRNTLSLSNLPYLKDHKVGNFLIMPAAAFIEMGLAALQSTGEEKYPISVNNFSIKAPLLLDEHVANELHLTLGEENLSIFAKTGNGWKLNATLQKGQSFGENLPNIENLEFFFSDSETQNFQDQYKQLKKLGYNFGPCFTSLGRVTGLGSSRVVAEISVCEGVIDLKGGDICNSVLIDAMIQLYLLANQPNLDSLMLPLSVKAFKVFSPLPENQQLFIEVKLDNKTATLFTKCDEKCQIIALMEGLDLVKTNLMAFEKSLSGKEALPTMLKDQFFICPGIPNKIWKNEKFLGVQENLANLIQACQQNSTDLPNDKVAFGNLGYAISLGILKTFLELGASQLKIGVNLTLGEFMGSLGIAQEHIFPTRRYLKLLCNLKNSKNPYFVEKSKDIFQVNRTLPTIEEIEKLFFDMKDEIFLKFEVEQLGIKLQKNLPAILKGEIDALEVFFPPEKSDKESSLEEFSAANIYSHSQYLIRPYSVLATVMEKIFEKRESLNILEIGAGTGSATQFVVDAIKKHGTKYHYTFTDISAVFFQKARDRFAKEIEHFTFQVLDVEKDPKTMGFGPYQYDMIVASNVLHVTKDLKESCKNLRHLLKPSGLAVIVELFEAEPLMDISFTLLPGFSQFEDKELRPDYPLISAEKWKGLLLDGLGFSDVAIFSTCQGATGLVLAEATSNYEPFKIITSKQKNLWQLAGTWKNQTEALSSTLTKLGKKTNILTSNINNCSSLDIENTEGIIFTVDNYQAESMEDEYDQLAQASYKITENFLNFLKNVLEVFEGKQLPKLFLITVGQTYVVEEDEILAPPIESPLSGIFKCYLSENGLTRGRHIDLDPKETSQTNVHQILSELFKEDTEFLIRYRSGVRIKRRLIPAMNSLTPKFLPLSMPSSERFELVLPSKTNAIIDLKFAASSNSNELKGSQVEIQVMAAAHNFKDLFCIKKPSEFFNELNSVAADYAGVVVGVGPDVGGKRKIGDRVLGAQKNRPIRSHIVIDDPRHVAAMPSNMLFQEGATLGTVFLTAYYFLIEVGNLSKGQTILIHGASGGVGLLAVQIARHIGAEVIATAGSNRKRRYLQQIIGIQHVFSSRNLSFGEGVLKATNGNGVDVVLNFLTGPGFKETSLQCLAKGGKFLEMAVLNVWSKEEINELRNDVIYHCIDLSNIQEHDLLNYMSTLERMLEVGQINALPYIEFSLTNIRNALNYLEKVQHIGKVVLKVPKKPNEEAKLFNDKGSYLITGGCGGIGFEVGKWMCQNGAKNMILIGRKKPVEKVQEEIDSLNISEGLNIRTVQADIGDFNAVGKLIWDISKSGNELRGIMHSAGCLWDAVIQKQTMANFEETMNSKVKGTWNLHHHTKNLSLEHFVLFSTGVALIGNPGQSNHCAANTFLDCFAHYRHSMGLVATSLNWGQWGEVGVAAGKDLSFANPISTTEGLNALGLALRNPATVQIAPLEINTMNIGLLAPWTKAYLEIYRKNQKQSSGAQISEEEFSGGLGSPETFLEDYEAAEKNEEKQQDVIYRHISHILSNLLRLEEEEILESDTTFEDLGLDSLMFIELRNGLQRMLSNTGTAVSATDLADCINLQEICDKIRLILNGNNHSGNNNNEGLSPKLRELIVEDSKLWKETSENLILLQKNLSPPELSNVATVFVTGGTGNLGSYMIAELVKYENVKKVVCLVRGEKERLMEKLEDFGLGKEEISKVSAVIGDLAKAKFGMDERKYENLAKNVDAIVHCAVHMGHLQLYSETSQVRTVTVHGTQRIIDLASTSKLKWILHASTVVSAGFGSSTTEKESNALTKSENYPEDSDLDFGYNFGYGISKFICDRLVSEAAKLGLPLKAFRFPTMSGESSSGKLDMQRNHYLRKMMHSLQTGHVLKTPFPMGSVPIDLAAKYSLEIFFSDGAPSGFYHMANPNPIPETELLNLVPKFGPLFKFAKTLGQVLRKCGKNEDAKFLKLLKSECFSEGLELSPIENLIPSVSKFNEFVEFLKSPELENHLREQKSFCPQGKIVEYSEFLEKLEKLGEKSLLYPWIQVYRDGKTYFVEDSAGNTSKMHEKFEKDYNNFFEHKMGKVFNVLPNFKEIIPEPLEIARMDMTRALEQVIFWES